MTFREQTHELHRRAFAAYLKAQDQFSTRSKPWPPEVLAARHDVELCNRLCVLHRLEPDAEVLDAFRWSA